MLVEDACWSFGIVAMYPTHDRLVIPPNGTRPLRGVRMLTAYFVQCLESFAASGVFSGHC